MRTRPIAILIPLLLLSMTASAQQATKPIRYTWVATTVADWPTAAAALAAANGDGTVIALPTRSAEHSWVILKRTAEGSIWVPDDEPHVCEVLDDGSEAIALFASLDACRNPMIIAAPDGRPVVLSLKNCSAPTRQRTVRR